MQVSTIQELVTGYEASLRTCDLFGPCGKFLCIDSCLNYLFMAVRKNCWSAETFLQEKDLVNECLVNESTVGNTWWMCCTSFFVFIFQAQCSVSLVNVTFSILFQKMERESPQRRCSGFGISWHSTLTSLASVLWPWITLMLQLQALQH